MSEKVSMIDATDDATTANNGGDAPQQGSEEGKEPHSAQAETQVSRSIDPHILKMSAAKLRPTFLFADFF